jgi:hypothetical protein
MSPLSELTVVSYRRVGQARGSPHRAVLPGRVEDAVAAEAALAAVVGEVWQVRVMEVRRRPGAGSGITREPVAVRESQPKQVLWPESMGPPPLVPFEGPMAGMPPEDRNSGSGFGHRAAWSGAG